MLYWGGEMCPGWDSDPHVQSTPDFEYAASASSAAPGQGDPEHGAKRWRTRARRWPKPGMRLAINRELGAVHRLDRGGGVALQHCAGEQSTTGGYEVIDRVLPELVPDGERVLKTEPLVKADG